MVSAVITHKMILFVIGEVIHGLFPSMSFWRARGFSEAHDSARGCHPSSPALQ